jgi:hypothetical protein
MQRLSWLRGCQHQQTGCGLLLLLLLLKITHAQLLASRQLLWGW